MAPILADRVYGDDSAFCTRLQALELEYVLAVSAQISIYGPETTFAVPRAQWQHGAAAHRRPTDRKPESVRALAERLPKRAWRRCLAAPPRRRADQEPLRLRPRRRDPSGPQRDQPAREERLIIEWPQGADAPTDYWLSKLPPNSPASGSPGSPACAALSSSTTAS